MITEPKKPYAIHWFRRDLRISGNQALAQAMDQFQGRVVGVFFFDEVFLSRPDFSVNRFAFFLNTLRELQKEFRAAGGDLIVLDSGPEEGFKKLFKLIRESGRTADGAGELPAMVSWSRDYEPYARERDKKIAARMAATGIATHTERDHLLIEPQEISKEDGSFYKVYTPFAKRWFEKLATAEIQERLSRANVRSKFDFDLSWGDLLGASAADLDRLEYFSEKNSARVSVPIPTAGHTEAMRRINEYQEKVSEYALKRDYPILQSNSGMSIFLKNGSVSISQIIAAFDLRRQRIADKTGETTFLKELCWREFYYHILWHCPWVESESFLERYRSLKWENSLAQFEAWKNGMTGYPIVDAGMRELNTTGLMHNRVRMIVASFLTKHLLIDWKWGERYFMEKLIDGDMAANNGGWQWAASTGCDAQPYFRVFNPQLQSEKFDADGAYIKKYVPELAGLSAKEIHAPTGLFKPVDYPEPIVEHSFARIRAIERYKSI